MRHFSGQYQHEIAAGGSDTAPNFLEDRHRVFVYGTLKKGFHNSYLLQDSEFFGGAVTVREPPYIKLNERGELDGQMAPLPAFDETSRTAARTSRGTRGSIPAPDTRVAFDA